jgi:hypothetical protein
MSRQAAYESSHHRRRTPARQQLVPDRASTLLSTSILPVSLTNTVAPVIGSLVRLSVTTPLISRLTPKCIQNLMSIGRKQKKSPDRNPGRC